VRLSDSSSAPGKYSHGYVARTPLSPISLQVDKNVTVTAGETAHMNCNAQNLGEFTVSWIRGSDTRVLSVGSVLFSSDIRYQIGSGNHPGFGPSVWTLQIRNVSRTDEGWYECQVNTDPKISNTSHLYLLPSRPRWSFDRDRVKVGEEDGGSQWRGPVGRLLTEMNTSDNSISNTALRGPGQRASAASVAFTDVMETTELSTKKTVAAASTVESEDTAEALASRVSVSSSITPPSVALVLIGAIYLQSAPRIDT